MSNMFINYDNVNNLYKPNNMCQCKPKVENAKEPYEEYNAEGELVGYYWYYGNPVNFIFNMEGEFTVDGNSIIYRQTGQAPTEQTVGFIGQKAYNAIDLISWTCTAIDNDVYTWTQDEGFAYPQNAMVNIYVDPTEYLKGKTLTATFYNFRNEIVFVKTYDASISTVCTIDEETSKNIFVKGVYYLSLVCGDKNGELITLIDVPDLTLNVK